MGLPECFLLVAQRITKYPVLVERILQNTGGEKLLFDVCFDLLMDPGFKPTSLRRLLTDPHSRHGGAQEPAERSGADQRRHLPGGHQRLRIHEDGPSEGHRPPSGGPAAEPTQRALPVPQGGPDPGQLLAAPRGDAHLEVVWEAERWESRWVVFSSIFPSAFDGSGKHREVSAESGRTKTPEIDR